MEALVQWNLLQRRCSMNNSNDTAGTSSSDWCLCNLCYASALNEEDKFGIGIGGSEPPLLGKIKVVHWHSIQPWVAMINQDGTLLVWNAKLNEMMISQQPPSYLSTSSSQQKILSTSSMSKRPPMASARNKTTYNQVIFIDRESIQWSMCEKETNFQTVISPRYIVLASNSRITFIRFNEQTEHGSILPEQCIRQPFTCLELLSDELIAIGCSGGAIVIWNYRAWRMEKIIKSEHVKEILRLHICPYKNQDADVRYSSLLFSVGLDGLILVFYLQVSQAGHFSMELFGVFDRKEMSKHSIHTTALVDFMIDCDNQMVITLAHDKKLVLWDLQALFSMHRMEECMSEITSVTDVSRTSKKETRKDRLNQLRLVKVKQVISLAMSTTSHDIQSGCILFHRPNKHILLTTILKNATTTLHYVGIDDDNENDSSKNQRQCTKLLNINPNGLLIPRALKFYTIKKHPLDPTLLICGSNAGYLVWQLPSLFENPHGFIVQTQMTSNDTKDMGLLSTWMDEKHQLVFYNYNPLRRCFQPARRISIEGMQRNDDDDDVELRNRLAACGSRFQFSHRKTFLSIEYPMIQKYWVIEFVYKEGISSPESFTSRVIASGRRALAIAWCSFQDRFAVLHTIKDSLHQEETILSMYDASSGKVQLVTHRVNGLPERAMVHLVSGPFLGIVFTNSNHPPTNSVNSQATLTTSWDRGLNLSSSSTRQVFKEDARRRRRKLQGFYMDATKPGHDPSIHLKQGLGTSSGSTGTSFQFFSWPETRSSSKSSSTSNSTSNSTSSFPNDVDVDVDVDACLKDATVDAIVSLQSIGPSFTCPREIQWSANHRNCALIYEHAIYIYHLNTPGTSSTHTINPSTFAFTNEIAVAEQVESVIWYQNMLCVATRSQMELVFTSNDRIFRLPLFVLAPVPLQSPFNSFTHHFSSMKSDDVVLSSSSSSISYPLKRFTHGPGKKQLLGIHQGFLVWSRNMSTIESASINHPLVRLCLNVVNAKIADASKLLLSFTAMNEPSSHTWLAEFLENFGLFQLALELPHLEMHLRLRLATKGKDATHLQKCIQELIQTQVSTKSSRIKRGFMSDLEKAILDLASQPNSKDVLPNIFMECLQATHYNEALLIAQILSDNQRMEMVHAKLEQQDALIFRK